MKSAYELAMERLSKTSPAVQLSDAQRKELAEVDSVYAAKVAEREIFLQGQLAKVIEAGDYDAISQIERQLASEKKRLQSEMEEKKELIRSPKG